MHQPRQNTPQVSIATRTARPTQCRPKPSRQNTPRQPSLLDKRNFCATCSSISRPLTRPPDHYGQFSISSRRLNRPSRPTLTNQKLKRQQQSSSLLKVARTWRQVPNRKITTRQIKSGIKTTLSTGHKTSKPQQARVQINKASKIKLATSQNTNLHLTNLKAQAN